MKRFLFIVCGVIIGIALGGQAQAATLYASPGSGSYHVGDTITVYVRINTSSAAINAAEGTVTWTTSTLQFVSVSASGSIFKYWPIDPVVNGSSAVIFSGGLPSPGYTGSAGTAIKLTFRAKATGTGKVSMLGGKILANDGLGTDLYTGQSAGTYTITSATSSGPTSPSVPSRPTPTVTSSTHPDQTVWYTKPEVELSWTKPSGASGVSYQLSRESTTIPDDTIDGSSTATSVTLAEEGVWYFHVRAKYSSGWSSTAHYALHYDRTAPLAFTPTYDSSAGSSGYGQILAATTDATSAVVRYTYAIDDSSAVEGTTVYDLANIVPGEHVAVVTAYDAAGNSRTGTLTFSVTGYAMPTLTSVSSPLLLLDSLVVRGTANGGDIITMYVNGDAVGQVTVAPNVSVPDDGTTVRFPWSFTSDRLWRPGIYTVTATATSTTGLISAPTPSRQVRIVGQAIIINGRPVAIWSVLTPLSILVLSLFVLIVVVLTRLSLAVWLMHRHEQLAEEELEILRSVNQRQGVTRPQLDAALEEIEEDLAGTNKPTRPRRRKKKRTRS